ncbi:MAG: hypothetical protein U0807_17680 [Candidatus Binatia bacterium]
MPFPQRPLFPRSARLPPGKGQGSNPVLGVGRRVLVACSSDGQRRATLTDEKGITPLGSLGDGTEVEIQAWQPRGVGGPRYRVRAVGDGVEGWIGAGSLRAVDPPLALGSRCLPSHPKTAAKTASTTVKPSAAKAPTVKPATLMATTAKTAAKTTAAKVKKPAVPPKQGRRVATRRNPG